MTSIVRQALLATAFLVAAACTNGSREVTTNNRSYTIDETAPRNPDVIFVPTKMEVVEQMLTLAHVDSTDIVYDLGSGDGRIVITAASRRGAHGVGIDIDPERIRESIANADSAGVSDRVEFRRADLFRTDLRAATAVTLYLLPSLNVKLRPKLLAELQPGTPVVSNSFEMGDWKPDSAVLMGERYVYLWVIPANVAGTWELEYKGAETAGRTELEIEQLYQDISGTARVNGRPDSLRETRLRGDSIYFTFDINGVARTFAGTVGGANMTGATPDGSLSWRATRRGIAR